MFACKDCLRHDPGHENKQEFPMPIRKHLTDKTAFGPAAIEAMSKAFEGVCTALRVYAGDEKGREIIAARIIDVARTARPCSAALIPVAAEPGGQTAL
jgi:hypothetical protein